MQTDSDTLLVRYSLDKHVRYSTYLLIFKSWKGSSEALKLPHEYLRDYTIGFIIDYTMITSYPQILKVNCYWGYDKYKNN